MALAPQLAAPPRHKQGRRVLPGAPVLRCVCLRHQRAGHVPWAALRVSGAWIWERPQAPVSPQGYLWREGIQGGGRGRAGEDVQGQPDRREAGGEERQAQVRPGRRGEGPGAQDQDVKLIVF